MDLCCHDRKQNGSLLSSMKKHAPSLIVLLSVVCSIAPSVSATRTRLTWVNGIGYSLEHMRDGAPKISRFFGGKRVSFCHNPTAMSHEDDMMGYLGDLSQAGSQKLGRITAEVESLTRHLKDAVAAVGKRGKVIHIAHSQGALVTSLAARRLTLLEMSKIEVIAFGGAAALQKKPETPFSRCVNYYSANDPLLLLVPSAAAALRSGFIADEEFCFLAPREGDPVQDHALLGLTYSEALAWEGKRYQQLYQSSLHRLSRSMLLSLVSLCIAYDNKMQEIMKALIRPLLYVLMFLHSRCMAPLLSLFRAKIVAPFLVFLLVVADFLVTTFRRFRGEQYLSIDTIKREGGAKQAV